jgi:hypothetical protein
LEDKAELPQEKINSLIDSVDEERAYVIAVKGGSTNW